MQASDHLALTETLEQMRIATGFLDGASEAIKAGVVRLVIVATELGVQLGEVA